MGKKGISWAIIGNYKVKNGWHPLSKIEIMNKQQAQHIIKETFEAPFDKAGFIIFIKMAFIFMSLIIITEFTN